MRKQAYHLKIILLEGTAPASDYELSRFRSSELVDRRDYFFENKERAKQLFSDILDMVHPKLRMGEY